MVTSGGAACPGSHPIIDDANPVCGLSREQIVREINTFLRGWTGYFRHGNSARVFDEVSKYAQLRLALYLAKRHRRRTAWGFSEIYRSPTMLGLISLNGIVVAPRPHRPWREQTECRR